MILIVRFCFHYYIWGLALGCALFAGCNTAEDKQELTMTSSEIVNAMVQIAIVKGVLEVSAAPLHDSLFQHYKTEVELLTKKDYSEVIKNLTLLEKYPDSLVVYQTRALDTLRNLQNVFVYQRTSQ